MDSQDSIIIGSRSDDVIVDKGVYHFTMNEALSLEDRDKQNPSLDVATQRGFQEENGIIRNNGSVNITGATCGNYCYMDFNFDSNKCELGVNSFWRISLDSSITNKDKFIKEFQALRQSAKDGYLETTQFEMMSVDSIRAFLAKNKNTKDAKRISWGLFFALNLLAVRYDQKVL